MKLQGGRVLWLGISLISCLVMSCKDRGLESQALADDPEPLQSSAAKTRICEGLASDFDDRGVRLEDCLDGEFMVTREMKDVVGGRDLTTRLDVSVSFADKRFSVSVARGVSINADGKIVVSNDWPSFALLGSELGTVAIIQESHVGSANVVRLDSSRDLPAPVTDWSNYGEAPDYDLLSTTYYSIAIPDNLTQIIGYIVVEDACSAETESCYLSTQKFALDGQMIGDVEEEFRGRNE